MNPIFRNILAVIAGTLLGSVINGAIVAVSGHIIPPPAGAVLTTVEGLKASMHLMEPKHFLMPFLAHAIGTLVGAFLSVKIGVSRKILLAMIVGVLFLIGGTINVMMLPSPIWFNVLDLVVAYIPMAYLGARLGIR